MANNYKTLNGFAGLAPELKIKIFQALPNLHSAVALRLTCSELNELYLRYESGIKAALRDRQVQVISSFYTFLTTLHIPRSALKHPPSDGWSHMDPQNCAEFGKTGFVVDVLRHLPYIAETANLGDNLHNIELRCYALDYSTRTPAEFRSIDSKMSAWLSEPLSKHKILVAKNSGNGGMVLVLDTARAEINVQIIPYRGDLVMDIGGYFNMAARRCRNLEIMFVPGHDTIVDIEWKPEDGNGDKCPDNVGSLLAQEETYPTRRDAKWIRYLYRKAGWPGTEYQKERALRAIKMFVEARMD
ncbi:hypothetical protein SLS62_011268 [Diatrype stigma]|uniref:F-box domain-containing protein n=1 Tax=Diatrype stigma TaxID=117547 RepID=A0AAN9U4S1_9PEZI